MRLRPIGLILSGVVVASSACSVDATGPSPFGAPESAGLYKGGQYEKKPGGGEPASTYTVTFDPTRSQELRFGEHTLSIPAHSICREGSGYGPGMWNLSCATTAEPVTLTATVTRTAGGYPRIDISPDLRFSPSKRAELSLAVANTKRATKDWKILYCATESNVDCVDEALLDRSLETKGDKKSGTVFRRIKHLSGYLVAERSGYVVAEREEANY